MSGHLFGAALIIVVTLAVFWLGWHSHGLYTDERAILPKHSHRKGAPLESGPRETALLQPPRPDPPWRFAGESEQGWAAESAEYELLTQTVRQGVAEINARAALHQDEDDWESDAMTQTAELPEPVPGVDTPSDYMQSMTERVNAMIAVYEGDTNEWIHSMPRVSVDG